MTCATCKWSRKLDIDIEFLTKRRELAKTNMEKEKARIEKESKSWFSAPTLWPDPMEDYWFKAFLETDSKLREYDKMLECTRFPQIAKNKSDYNCGEWTPKPDRDYKKEFK